MHDRLETISRFHHAVNQGTTDDLHNYVTEDVVLSGPRGETTGIPALVEWIENSGIHLQPGNLHPVDHDRVVIEEQASWAAAPQEIHQVAPVYMFHGNRIAAIRRYDDLQYALEIASGEARLPCTRP